MFDYYYGNEAEQFSFIRVPRFFFTDDKCKKMSSDLKILYSLMLDRMCLSVKNNWIDSENRVYIIFTLQDVMDKMDCGHDKASNLLKELENFGLITRIRQGMGRPSLIYVRNFVSYIPAEDEAITEEMTEAAAIVESVENTNTESFQQAFDKNSVETVEKSVEESQTSEKSQSRLPKIRSHECGKSEVMTSENPQSRLPKSRSHDFRKTAPNYTEYNKTDIIQTEINQTEFIQTDVFESINQSYLSIPPPKKQNFSDRGSDRAKTLENVKARIDYDVLKANFSCTGDMVDEITEIITDVLMGIRQVYVNKKPVSQSVARKQYEKLTYEHVRYVIHSISEVEEPIRRPDVYITTSLFNAVYTLDISTFSGFTAHMGMSLEG